MTDTKRGKGRPAVDDPAVNFRLPASLVARIEAAARERLMQRDGLARAAFLLDALDRTTALAEADKRWPAPTANAVRDEARRIMAAALDAFLNESPRPRVSAGRLRNVNKRQMSEAADLIEAGGPLDQAIYAALPEWWREQIDVWDAAMEEDSLYARHLRGERIGQDEEDAE